MDSDSFGCSKGLDCHSLRSGRFAFIDVSCRHFEVCVVHFGICSGGLASRLMGAERLIGAWLGRLGRVLLAGKLEYCLY